MRLIDKDLILKTATDKEWGLWCEIVNIKFAPEVEAIPIEWIKSKKIEYEHDRYDYVRGCFDGFNDCIDYLINEWEKENEQNKENPLQID